MEKKKFTKEMRDLCRADFPEKAYKKHPTKTFLTTLKAMYVTERLNDVFGVGRWTIHVEIIKETDSYVLFQGEFESRDYDVCVPKQFGGHNTTGKNTELADGYKSAFTDCMSKIASYFEIGIEMFKGNIDGSGNKSTSPGGKTTTQFTKPPQKKEKPWLNPKTPAWENAINKLKSGEVELTKVLDSYQVSKPNQETLKNIKNGSK